LSKGLHQELYDPFAIAGADHWYDVGAQRVRALSNDLANRAFRPGWLRSVGPGWTNWAVESFMDEAAHGVAADPVAFRVAMLDAKGRNAGSSPNSVGGALRQRAVVQRVAQKAGWGAPMPKDTGSLGHTVPPLRNIAEDEGQECARDDHAREGSSPVVAQ
jgi:isoquinoline 1-oxidoreductase subunit beta